MEHVEFGNRFPFHKKSSKKKHVWLIDAWTSPNRKESFSHLRSNNQPRFPNRSAAPFNLSINTSRRMLQHKNARQTWTLFEERGRLLSSPRSTSMRQRGRDGRSSRGWSRDDTSFPIATRWREAKMQSLVWRHAMQLLGEFEARGVWCRPSRRTPQLRRAFARKQPLCPLGGRRRGWNSSRIRGPPPPPFQKASVSAKCVYVSGLSLRPFRRWTVVGGSIDGTIIG